MTGLHQELQCRKRREKKALKTDDFHLYPSWKQMRWVVLNKKLQTSLTERLLYVIPLGKYLLLNVFFDRSGRGQRFGQDGMRWSGRNQQRSIHHFRRDSKYNQGQAGELNSFDRIFWNSWDNLSFLLLWQNLKLKKQKHHNMTIQ